MAQADARQMWLTVTAYSMREARRTGQVSRNIRLGRRIGHRQTKTNNNTTPPQSKQLKTKHHNKTKKQIIWMSEQLEEYLVDFMDGAERPLVVKSTLKTFTQLYPHYSTFALKANTSASDSRANGEDDEDDEFGDIDFLDHCVQDVFEDYTD